MCYSVPLSCLGSFYAIMTFSSRFDFQQMIIASMSVVVEEQIGGGFDLIGASRYVRAAGSRATLRNGRTTHLKAYYPTASIQRRRDQVPAKSVFFAKAQKNLLMILRPRRTVCRSPFVPQLRRCRPTIAPGPPLDQGTILMRTPTAFLTIICTVHISYRQTRDETRPTYLTYLPREREARLIILISLYFFGKSCKLPTWHLYLSMVWIKHTTTTRSANRFPSNNVPEHLSNNVPIFLDRWRFPNCPSISGRDSGYFDSLLLLISLSCNDYSLYSFQLPLQRILQANVPSRELKLIYTKISQAIPISTSR